MQNSIKKICIAYNSFHYEILRSLSFIEKDIKTILSDYLSNNESIILTQDVPVITESYNDNSAIVAIKINGIVKLFAIIIEPDECIDDDLLVQIVNRQIKSKKHFELKDLSNKLDIRVGLIYLSLAYEEALKLSNNK